SMFRPSEQLDKPYAMAGVNVFAAETDAEARRLFTSTQMAFTNMFRGTRGKLQPPIDDIEAYWNPMEKMQAQSMLRCSFVGSAGLPALRRGNQRRRGDRRLGDLRPPGEAALIRDTGRHPRRLGRARARRGGVSLRRLCPPTSGSCPRR